MVYVECTQHCQFPERPGARGVLIPKLKERALNPGRTQLDVIIVGAGIAGASLAYFLTQRGVRDVVLLEREAQPAMHTTGRSAASVNEIDKVSTVQRLKVLGASFLRNPPAGFAETPLLEQSGMLRLYRGDAWTEVQQRARQLRAEGIALDLLDPEAVLALVPPLAPGRFDGGVLLAEDGQIDVHALLWGYLGHARRAGAELRCGVEVTGLRVEGSTCQGVATSDGDLHARWVVNAAGAWAGRLGASAGATPIELTPRRRTIVTFAPPAGMNTRGWPFVFDEAFRLYFGPASAGLMLACPMDEEPMEPCDPRPDELVVAGAIERLKAMAPALVPRTLRRRWSGLRTFSPDGGYVIGEDPALAGFFWLAGQGGSGIETSGAVGAIAADLLIDGRTERFDAASVSPARFA